MRSDFVRAALELQLGRCHDAIRTLEACFTHIDATPLYAFAARRQLGVLLGGDRGQRLVCEADAFFRAEGVVDPARLVGALIPGFASR